jgi:hypothetical protein
MSLAWKQEYRMASEADQIDWPALLHAVARPENASAQAHGPLAAVHAAGEAENGAALAPAGPVDFIEHVLDLQVPASIAVQLANLFALAEDLPTAGGSLPSDANAAGDAPVSSEVTAEFQEMLASSWPAAQQMLQEAVLAAFPEAQFLPSKGPPALIADFVLGVTPSEAAPLVPGSDFPG